MVSPPASETTPPTRPRRVSRRLVLFGAGLALLLVAAGITVAAVVQIVRNRSAAGELSFAPAQADEFLVIVAPFRRLGGEPTAVGTALANDLRQAASDPAPYRVETLERAPDEALIPRLIENYKPAILVTGTYDGTDILATVRLQPPGWPPLPEGTEGAPVGMAALYPEPNLESFRLYAPQALSQPLAYLQAWIDGQSRFWRGDYTTALPRLQESLRRLPRQAPPAHRDEMDRFAGLTNRQLGFIVGPLQGNWQAARDYYERAWRQNPADWRAALGLAAAHARLSNPDAAEAIILRLLRAEPTAWQPYLAFGQLSLQRGDVAVGLAAYDQAIALLGSPDNPGSRLALADIYLDRGYYRLIHDDPLGAQADLEQAIALGRADVFAQSNLAWAAYRNGDYERAVQAGAVAAQMAPQRPDLAFNKALYLLASGRSAEAETAYQEAIALAQAVSDAEKRRSYLDTAYQDLEALLLKQPDRETLIRALQERIQSAGE
ncbi:MAG: tetratricopeptide repeat protein [Caldilineales bacterium]|nr:tetratricopeptide repeat protein [Caldilineales bacterium]